MSRNLLLIAGFFSLVASVLYWQWARVEGDDLHTLTETGSCAGCNLRGVNLSGLNLEGADLRRVDLSNTNLSSTRLVRADFWQANLNGSTLDSVDLTGENLRGLGSSRPKFAQS